MTLHLFNALYKNLCRPPNWERSRGFCYHFAIKPAVANQKVVISLGLFCPKYHEFFTPTPPSQAVCLSHRTRPG